MRMPIIIAAAVAGLFAVVLIISGLQPTRTPAHDRQQTFDSKIAGYTFLDYKQKCLLGENRSEGDLRV